MSNKAFNILMCIICFFLLFIIPGGCGSDKRMCIDGQCKTYQQYGLFNEPEVKDDTIKYRVIDGNVFWGIVLFETIFAPVYVLGYALYEPIGVK